MSDIFISYAREDIAVAVQLVAALQRQGYSVWWDRNIRPGEQFDEEIQKALDNAGCVVVLWSQASVRSRWVRDEANEGLKRHVLVPVRVDSASIPLGFKRLQATNLTGWNYVDPNLEFDNLLTAIARLLGRPLPRNLFLPPKREPLSKITTDSPLSQSDQLAGLIPFALPSNRAATQDLFLSSLRRSVDRLAWKARVEDPPDLAQRDVSVLARKGARLYLKITLSASTHVLEHYTKFRESIVFLDGKKISGRVLDDIPRKYRLEFKIQDGSTELSALLEVDLSHHRFRLTVDDKLLYESKGLSEG